MRLTFHRFTVAAAASATALCAGAGAAATYVSSTYAAGLNNPRGLAFGPDGLLYVAEGGSPNGASGPTITGSDGNRFTFEPTGAVARIASGGGAVTRVVTGLPALVIEAPNTPPGTPGSATGPQGIAFAPNGTGYVVVGLGAPPDVRTSAPLNSVPAAANLASVFSFTVSGPTPYTATRFADIGAYESAYDPDGAKPDSNPFHIAATSTGLLVTDAGGNTVLGVAPSGTVSQFALLPPHDGAQSVPTGIAVDGNGVAYVGELTGQPFKAGSASVFSITGANAPLVPYKIGLTNITDLAFGADGSLYVLEADSNGLATPGGSGTLLRYYADGTVETVISGLVVPTGLAIGKDQSIYVTNFSPAAGAGQVIRIAAIPEPATWATLVVGFGLAGGAVRRARRTVHA